MEDLQKTTAYSSEFQV